ncbi:FixH family protein [Cytobacillus dafuensis]|uniref:FixH family protein n=1 Tax=Cytobacillus dafuensis TaxID=1742359 RepID=A0A5B8ZAH7_CYTDA|nr:FixH family protein [Cytobacillus dafuensis]QED49253.1 FixH family protein [Cytobacillus dafuensis]
MKKWMTVLLMSSVLLAGCGNTGQEKNNGDQNDAELPAIIEAVIDIPEKAEVGKETELAVTVKQGKELVEDASEVKFEVWKEGQKDSSEKIEAKHSEKGKYIAKHTFSEDGVYNVQSHVTARNMHTMPTKTIQVGNVEAAQHEHNEQGDEHGQYHGDVSIHLQKPEQVKASQQIPLAVHLQKDNKPLTKANVRLEIFQKDSNPAWVDMTEGENGEYTTDYQFPASGNYTVRIHVENDEGLHEHTEEAVTVE